jgi:hypothetical protein
MELKNACPFPKSRLESAHFSGILPAASESGASTKERSMNRTFFKMIVLLCTMMVVASVLPAGGQELSKRKMTNQDVLDMVSMGLGDDVILEKIRTAPETDFTTDLESLKALKAAKVSDPVIRAMINPKAAAAPAAPTAAAPAAAANPDVPEDIGVYIRVRGKLAEVTPEVVGWKSGGVLKGMATGGLTKGHVNGTIQGPKSALQVGNDAEFIVKCPEGTAITEYQLLRLDMKGDRREFRAMTGGIIHQSGGAEKNAEKFDYEKVAPRVFRIKLPPLQKGEFGFLPPGATAGNVASAGKLYTFGIKE